eukprot:5646892-Prymnesium_polylepis.2
MPPCFSKAEWPLQRVRLAEKAGFLFVTGSDATPPLEDVVGNIDVCLSGWPLADFVTVRRKEYLVGCNWKFLMQNTSETYHTSVVHKDSLGAMPSESVAKYLGVAPVGSWDAVHVPGDRSVVPLPGEAAPFPELTGLPASTYFVSLFPTLQLNVTRDCAWWMRVLPESATSRQHAFNADRARPCVRSTTRVTQGFLFPKETAASEGFDELLEPYLYRWDLAVREDNDISVNQQRAAMSPHHRPGPYHKLEFAVHRFDNIVLDAVLDGVAAQETVAVPPPSPHTAAVAAAATTAALPLRAPTVLRQQTPFIGTASGGRPFSGSAASTSLAPGATVCVTGATGFIALHLVHQLLERGYRVTAAVRSTDAAKLAPLNALAPLGSLEVVSGCDLLEP